MTREELLKKIQDGAIDTVQVAAPDMLARLVGKRATGDYFARELADGTTHGCNYLFAVNMEMDPQDGYGLANWNSGFGDFEMRPDRQSVYLLPWEEGSALIFCDFHHHDGRPVEQAPRTILRRQIERLAARGLHANVASELEFYLFNEDYTAAAQKHFTGLTPSSNYRIDYHLLQPGRDESILREMRNLMLGAGIPIENSKGEWGRGQHEINITYADPLTMADRHTIFKQGAKHIAHRHGKSVTFMAKPFRGEAGSSCHIHISLRNDQGNAFWDHSAHGPSALFQHFLGGLLKYSRELCYFFAPTINSYKRYEAMSWAPTRQAWATDNRTTGFRVVGHGASFRAENRMPGADANPYLAFAAMIAAGLAGLDEGLECGAEYHGNAYVDAALPALPSTLRESLDLFEKSAVADRSFGADVVEHYLHAGRLEVREFDAAVTDWERARYFERI
ncbi:MAG TPA: glutamine synthetase family protein [Chthoniobacteraceae bacterium]|jgi:glutamine synthetase